MITLPADIKQDDNWNGTSTDHGLQVRNLDSGMLFTEHQRIVCNAKTFISTMTYTAEELQENAARRALETLKEAFTEADGDPVYITKGIHQPNSDPHIQLRVGDDGPLYHLNVSAEEEVETLSGTKYFHWKAVSVSARIRNGNGTYSGLDLYDYAQWPAGVVAKTRYASRRNSISPGWLLKLNADIQAERDRAREQSDRDQLKNQVIAAITRLGLTIKNKRDSGKLIDGETVTFQTKTGIAKACSFDKATNKFTYAGTATTLSLA